MDDCIIGSLLLLLLLLLLLVDDSRVVKDRLVTMFLVDLRALASKVDMVLGLMAVLILQVMDNTEIYAVSARMCSIHEMFDQHLLK